GTPAGRRGRPHRPGMGGPRGEGHRAGSGMATVGRVGGIAVFLGPSLPVAEAAGILPAATFLAPARMGSVYRAVHDGARTVGIVDGFYERVPAVWHKEILWALAEGVRVYGAASMGALRAAELDTYGMIGVGEIYRQY